MAKFSIQAGKTSQSITLFVQDKTSTTGAGLIAIAPAAGSLLSGTTLYYSFTGANAAGVAVSLSVLATVGAAWSSGGIVTLDDTHLQGAVRLDIPNAMIAASKGQTVFGMLYGGTNMAPCPFEIEMTGWDNQDAVHGGMSAIPNAVPGAAGGVFIAGTNAPVTITGSGDCLTITSTGGNGNAVNLTGQGSGAALKATAGATGVGLNILSTASVAIYVSASNNGAIACYANGTNANAVTFQGSGNGDGLSLAGGATGRGIHVIGGSSSGEAMKLETTSGDALVVSPTAGHAIVATANGTSKHGAVITGGTSGTSDGIKAVAGTGGVDIRGNITGNVTGNLSGSIGSLGTGAIDTATFAAGTTIPRCTLVDTTTAVTNGVTLAADQVPLKKNTALNGYEFVMVSSSDGRTPVAGLTVSGFVSLDGVDFVALTNSPTGVSGGVYKVNLAAADTNANVLTFKFTATGADTTLISHLTQ